MDKNFLKNFLEWLRDLIESADLPLVMLVLVVLPFVVPAVPAMVTANNLTNNMSFSPVMSILSGVTVELLGFAGAILFLRSIMEWVKSRNKKSLVVVFLTGGAYAFYLAAIISINVVLDIVTGKPLAYVIVIALLSLLSIPSGLLAASRIDDQAEKLEAERLRKDRQNYRLEKLKIKQGFASDTVQVGNKKGDWRTLTPQERHEVIHVLSITDIMHKHNVSQTTAYTWKSRKS